MPVVVCTYTAHVVSPYTNPSGRYRTMLQHVLSHLLAQPARRLLKEGEFGGGGEARVAMSVRGVIASLYWYARR